MLMALQARSRPAADTSAKRLPSYSHLHELMRRFQVKDLVNVDVEPFLRALDEFEQLDVHSGPTL